MQLKVSFPPHIRSEETIERIMYSVALALMPATFFSVYLFGFDALLVTLVSVASCIGFEYLCNRIRKRDHLSCWDGSGFVTGLLLALNLPAGLPLGMVVLGSFVAIVFAKEVFGGLGFNIFNPALVARVFLLISFPAAMTSWPVHRGAGVDGLTSATPLGLIKTEGIEAVQNLGIEDMMLGFSGGCLGETSGIFLILGAAFLMYRKLITYVIPLGYMGSTVLFCWIAQLVDPSLTFGPLQHLFSGGLILGACFMATDMVTSPLTAKGQWVFAIGCGTLTAILRLWGSFPEGVSFAILLMNAAVPLIERWELRPKNFKKGS